MKMDRLKRVYEVYQQGQSLNFENPEYRRQVGDFITTALREDVGLGDITTQTVIPPDLEMKAVIGCKEDGVFCGEQELKFVYESKGITTNFLVHDGQKIKKGQRLVELSGLVQILLTLERTGLNIARRMSGIATTTSKYVSLLQGSGSMIAATRKVLTCELMEKRAVFVGGGLTHRIGLDKHIMVKDCHLDILRRFQGSEAIQSVIQSCESTNVPVEIEVENLEDGFLVAESFANSDYEGIPIIMLDNMKPEQMMFFVQKLRDNHLYDKILLEASGGVNLNNLAEYGACGVDVISTSGITEGAFSLDLNQKIEG